MDEDKLKINLNIVGCALPSIEIDRQDEYFYRQAAKAIPSILAYYKEAYKGLSEQEHYYMALVHFAANMYCQIDRNETKPFVDEMRRLTALIEDRLAR